MFEFAYKQTPCEEFARALASIYQNISRDNINALLYGVDELPQVSPLLCHSTHSEAAGLSIAHHPTLNNALLYKHAPYGGEHDHYDRLGFILTRNGKEILPDLGTTGYGAELHYGYYKNTATHNTLVVNQQNQSPIHPQLLGYTQTEDYTTIDAVVDWSQPEASVDSHTIVQWDKEAYQDVVFRRAFIWLDDIAIELNTILNPHNQQLDLTYHVRGEHLLQLENGAWKPITNPLSGALAQMTNTQLSEPNTAFTLHYEIEGQADFRQSIYTDSPVEVLSGNAPDNPATSDLAYSLIRSQQNALRTLVVHELSESTTYQVDELAWGESSIYFVLSSMKGDAHISCTRMMYDFKSAKLSTFERLSN
ncbi:hypothetical protein GCM10007906_03320 [Vibrio hyugaensis]|uniref:Heparinase II/III-like C-terminal domain-containing protein n=1 Tax=Vibrio hyugaensis TaxID=1534743 RepID=A0ABQ5Y0T9_9VIBR|nr:heparinase II/III family protein [Vibrio hyugaensis]GLR02745.1 hypothetical protein GCM10007906_03320 [Vibrio hyugaensis]